MADAQLKAVVQEGESRMNIFKVVVESRFSEELNPTVYPQVGFQGGGSPSRESLHAHLFCTSENLHTFRANDCKPRNVANIYFSLEIPEFGLKETHKNTEPVLVARLNSSISM